MKNILKPICALGIIFFVIQACEPKIAKTETQENQQVAACEIDSIPTSEGTAMISEAQTYIDDVNSTISGTNPKIPYGAKIPICELQEILKDLGDTPEVWVMMAMKDNKLEIVFQGLDDATNTYKYYDFTNPCPISCPE
jgi:hypothetical protein